jgi:hypothetical protein
VLGTVPFRIERRCGVVVTQSSIAGTVSVACTLTDRLAFLRVAECLRQEGGHALAVSRSDVLTAAEAGMTAGLVYDLEPGDARAAEFVWKVQSARPDWPVWLYYPPRAAVIERVADVAALRGVWATQQGTGPLHEKEIRVHVRRLVTSVPRVRLLCLLDSVLRPLPAAVRQYLEAMLEHRDHAGPRAFRVRNGAANFPGTIRHLERLSRAATGLGPKRLLDRLMLVFLTFKTLVFDVPLLSAAEQAGLSSKTFDRLRHHALGPDARWAELEPRAQFEFALMALAKACRVPQHTAQEVMHKVALEYSA